MNRREKEMEIKAWHLLLEDDAYRLDLPDDFYQTLLKRADELVLRQIIDLAEWQHLKNTADAVYQKTLHSLATRQCDRLDTVSIDLGIDTDEKTA